MWFMNDLDCLVLDHLFSNSSLLSFSSWRNMNLLHLPSYLTAVGMN